MPAESEQYALCSVCNEACGKCWNDGPEKYIRLLQCFTSNHYAKKI